MATIRSRPNSTGKSRYQAVVKLKGHPIVRETFGRKTDALKWAERTEAHIKLHGHAPESVLAGHTLFDAIIQYEKNVLPGLADTTQRAYSIRLAEWKTRLGPYALTAITPMVIGDACREIRERTSDATTNRIRGVLSVVLDHARLELRWIDHNPVRDVRKRPEHPERIRFLSDDERVALLAACRESSEPRLYPLVMLALSTGIRRSGLLGLRWRDIDLKTGTASYLAKGGRRLTATIHGEAMDILNRASRTPHISGYVFANLDGRPTYPDYAWRQARDASVEDFHFHDLRHTFATYALMAGATLAQLKHLLGHRSLAAVQRYAHMAREFGEDLTRQVVESWQA